MEKKELQQIFTQSFQLDNWKKVVRSYFGNVDFYKTSIDIFDENIEYHKLLATSIKEFGTMNLADNRTLKFYDITLKEDKHILRNRVGLRKLIHNQVIPGDIDAIIAVFHNPNDKDWRLTFISKSVFWDENFNEEKRVTSPRRYTYVLGEGESVKTAVSQFEKLKEEKITIKSLIELFNVEKLSKKFFDKYKQHYEKFNLYLTGEKFVKKGSKYEFFTEKRLVRL